ncbi:MAG: nucleotidyltransferase family protein [Candidatus Omnitrophica bacterium]|nr:nucleotidyltransferase family protein [Candidatus Omnitrophota bacterium]
MPKIPDEQKLILLCASLSLEESAQKELNALLALPLDWEIIKQIAEKEKLSPLLYVNLEKFSQSNHIPSGTMVSLKQIYLANLQRNLVLEKEIFRILELASDKKIKIILLKGLALVYALYKDHALRIMVDVDLFIARHELLPLKEIFLQSGYRANEETVKHCVQEGEYELMFSKKVFKEQYIYIDVHWKLLPSRPYVLRLPMAWERAEPLIAAGREIYSLSKEDNFLYLTLHLRRHIRDITLNSLVDIAELLKKHGQILDWDYIRDNARKNHFFNSVYFVLYLCQELLRVKIPDLTASKFKVCPVKKFLLGAILNRQNFFFFRRWKGAVLRLLLFDNPLDFLLYLWRVSFYERHFSRFFVGKA